MTTLLVKCETEIFVEDIISGDKRNFQIASKIIYSVDQHCNEPTLCNMKVEVTEIDYVITYFKWD